jgi:hypothetical protein
MVALQILILPVKVQILGGSLPTKNPVANATGFFAFLAQYKLATNLLVLTNTAAENVNVTPLK